MQVKHILIVVSAVDYKRYLKLKGNNTWQEILLKGLTITAKNRQE
jgi:hypothetical protein